MKSLKKKLGRSYIVRLKKDLLYRLEKALAMLDSLLISV